MRHVLLDYESRSEVNLKTEGVYNYSREMTTEILCLSWMFRDGVIHGHIMGTPDTPEYLEFLDAIQDPSTIVHAHNAIFERLMTTHALVRQEKRIKRVPTIEQYRCSMLRGLMCGLPGSLDQLSKALGLPVNKDMDGHRLMLKMCKQNKKTGEFPDSPTMRVRLLEYCMNDVRVEAAAEKILPEIPNEELPLLYLTERMNDRGVGVDVDTAVMMQKLMQEYAASLDTRCAELTGGASGRQVKALMTRLASIGLVMESLTKDQVRRALKQDELDPIAREILELRQESSKASTAKIGRIIDMAGAGNRIRGNLVWHGCHTGRFAGRGVQLQNFPRPTEGINTDTVIECVQLGDLDLLRALYTSPAEAVSSALRGLILAQRDRLIWADFSSIEARVLAFLAGDERSLQHYRDNVDLYKIMAAKIYGVPIEQITKPQRQLGKQAILGAGYQLGGKGFKKTCAGYQIEITEEMASKVIGIYREAHPEIVELWADLENTCMEAMWSPGTVVRAKNKMAAKKSGDWLLLRLLSGRKLQFYKPHIKEKKTPWGDMKEVIHYTGTYLGKPSIESLYGGSITAMATQATARDVMTNAMLRLDAAGLNVILTVHDEIVCEDSPDREGEFVRIMETAPSWIAGLPLKVESFNRIRYGK